MKYKRHFNNFVLKDMFKNRFDELQRSVLHKLTMNDCIRNIAYNVV